MINDIKLPVYSDGCHSRELVYAGACMTREQAHRYGDRNIPKHLKRIEFKAYVFTSDIAIHGDRYHRITYGKEC